jgi:beta-phosphoglucomutase-like phosphatase (HAD superfamily)
MTLAERARIMARRQELYREKHPDQKPGSPGAKARWNAGETVSPAFTSEVAAITGKVERVVQLDVSRGTKIGEQALALVTRTPLDNARYLDTLKRVPPAEQVERVQRDLADPPRRTKPDPDAAFLAWAEEGQNLHKAAHWNRSFARTVLLSSLTGRPIGRITRAFT